MKSLVSWVINIVATGREDVPDLAIYTGSRVRTKLGMGTVIGGTFHVRLDNPKQGQHENDRSHSFNIDKMQIVPKV